MTSILVLFFLHSTSIANAGADYQNCLSLMNSQTQRFEKSQPIPEDAPPFVVNPEGQVEVLDADRIVSRAISGDTETITYKVIHKSWDSKTRNIKRLAGKESYEIKRANGLILSTNHIRDLNRELEKQKTSFFLMEENVSRFNASSTTQKIKILLTLA